MTARTAADEQPSQQKAPSMRGDGGGDRTGRRLASGYGAGHDWFDQSVSGGEERVADVVEAVRG